MTLDYAPLQRDLADVGYIADDALAMALCLMIGLGRPLLIEGEAGVEKTEIGKALAQVLKTRLIRLQCYEGLDANATIYEWNYQRQLLAIRAHERDAMTSDAIERHIFSEDYLLRRPLLEAISQPTSPVLLIDEIDRADEEFEAFLLEILSEFQITVPELGTIAACSIPQVVLTSNGTRALSDALRRRCLYSYLDFPDERKELVIMRARLLRRRHRPERPIKLLVLLDASGSMSVYSRYFLNFVRGLISRWLHADAFLFHTRLVHIADALRERDPSLAMARLSLMADGFGGGPRIATSLKIFSDGYSKEALGSRSVGIVMSDGYDTDPLQALAVELRRLKRRAHRLVWLNPLLGWKDYAQVARSMAVALHYVDCFATAHSLASLASLEDELARL